MIQYILCILLIQGTKKTEHELSSNIERAPFISTSTDRQNRSSKTPPPVPRKPNRNTELIEESDSSSDVTSLIEQFGGGKKLDPTPKMFRKSYLGSVDPFNENEVKIYKELKNLGSTQNSNEFIKKEKGSSEKEKNLVKVNKSEDDLINIKQLGNDKIIKNIQDDLKLKKQSENIQLENINQEENSFFLDDYMIKFIKEKLNLVLTENPYKYEESELNLLIKTAIELNIKEGNYVKDDFDLIDIRIKDLFNKEVNLIVLKIVEILEKRFDNITNTNKKNILEDVDNPQHINSDKPKIVKRSIFFDDKNDVSDLSMKNEKNASQENANYSSTNQKNASSTKPIQKNASSTKPIQKNASITNTSQRSMKQVLAPQSNLNSFKPIQKNVNSKPIQKSIQPSSSQIKGSNSTTSQKLIQQGSTKKSKKSQTNSSTKATSKISSIQLSKSQKIVKQVPSPKKIVNKKNSASLKNNDSQNPKLMSQKLKTPSTKSLKNDVEIFTVNNQKSNLRKMRMTASSTLVFTSRTREPRYSA